MKKENKFFLFFATIFLICWNPLTFYLLYSGDNMVYNAKDLKALFWILPFITIVLIYFLRKGKVVSGIKNLFFLGSFLGILCFILVLINALIGVFIDFSKKNDPKTATQNGIIFEPGSAASYKSVEFDFTVQINSLGLRNKEFDAEKKEGTYRILCFGDSWTLGWGVSMEKSWPALLEQFLKKKGYSGIEVINCGKIGAYTTGYKKYISKAVPVLKPDLVLVGVLQLDDLAQSFEFEYRPGGSKKTENLQPESGLLSQPKRVIQSLFIASFGNYPKLLGKNNTIQISGVWKRGTNNIIDNLSPIPKRRFMVLPDTVKSLYRSGNLNPALLKHYINYPDRTLTFNSPDNDATKFAIGEMSNDIKEMKAVCQAHNAGIIFLNLPMHYFTGHKVFTSINDNVLDKFYVENNKIDSIYSSIAAANQIDYFQLTEQFLALPDKEKYFFRFDGHPSEAGYEEIALGIGNYLINNKKIPD